MMKLRKSIEEATVTTSRGNVLTAAEAEVMNVIWDHQPIAMPEIVSRLPRDLAYTTVMTTVRILESKGFIKQAGKQGRAFTYEAKVAKSAVRKSMMQDLASRLFGGSVKSMVMNLLEEEELNSKDLDELKRTIESLEDQK